MAHRIVTYGAAFVHTNVRPSTLDLSGDFPLPPQCFPLGGPIWQASAAYWYRDYSQCETPFGESTCRCGHFTLEWPAMALDSPPANPVE